MKTAIRGVKKSVYKTLQYINDSAPSIPFGSKTTKHIYKILELKLVNMYTIDLDTTRIDLYFV